MSDEAHLGMSAGANREFTTTHWRVVLAAGDAPSPPADLEDEVRNLQSVFSG